MSSDRKCPYYLGWIHIRTSENEWVDRLWCSRFNDVCQPWNSECDIEAEGEEK